MYRIGLSVLALILASCTSAGPSSPPSPRVAVVGDSISAGINSELSIQRPTIGWVHMLTQNAGRDNLVPDFSFRSLFGPEATLVNLSKPGSRFRDWIRAELFESIVQARPNYVIVLLGGNDLWAQIQDGIWSEAEQEQLARDRDRFFEKLAASLPDARVLVIGYYDLFDGQSSRLPDQLRHLRGLSDWTRAANDQIAEGALKRNWWYLDILLPFQGHGYARLLGGEALDPPYFRMPLSQFDIHPNTAGHRALAEEVSQFFLRVLK